MRQKSAETYLEVLALVADGFRNKEIAARLKISAAYVSQIKKYFDLIDNVNPYYAEELLSVTSLESLLGLPTLHVAKKTEPRKKIKAENKNCRYYIAPKRDDALMMVK